MSNDHDYETFLSVWNKNWSHELFFRKTFFSMHVHSKFWKLEIMMLYKSRNVDSYEKISRKQIWNTFETLPIICFATPKVKPKSSLKSKEKSSTKEKLKSSPYIPSPYPSELKWIWKKKQTIIVKFLVSIIWLANQSYS